MDLAEVIEGMLPILMHYNGFYITGDHWVKFSRNYPDASFDEFWLYKLRKYDESNTSAKAFFSWFERDRLEHGRIFLKRRTACELRPL